MIPTHKLTDNKVKEIRVVKLGSLSQYNIMEPHRHDYIELFFFRKGGGIHEIDFTKLPVDANSIHLVSAGRVHRLKRELNSEGYVVLFHPSIFDRDHTISEFLFELDCYDIGEYEPIYHFLTDRQKEVDDLVESLWQHYQSDDDFKHQFILHKLTLLCLHCIKVRQFKSTDISRDQEFYTAFRKALRQNFKEKKKVKEYAETLGVSTRKLNEIVSERTGLSVSNLIHRQVILEARRLLNSGITSKEVAFQLNFEDPAHFSKFFKSQTGESPSEFQRSVS